MSDYRIPATFVGTDGQPLWETEDAWVLPAVGHGVVDERGDRYRVVDVWLNYEKRGGGPGDYGVYVFVEPATDKTDRWGDLNTAYYRGN